MRPQIQGRMESKVKALARLMERMHQAKFEKEMEARRASVIPIW
jgi:hypothetical protein